MATLKIECQDKLRILGLFITIVMLLSGCRTTRKDAIRAFEALPFQDSLLIAQASKESFASDVCRQVIVEVVYYDQRKFAEVLDGLEIALFDVGWEQVGQDLSNDARIQYSSYRLKDNAYLSVRPDVNVLFTPNFQFADLDEVIDLETLSLPNDQPIDNGSEDGYFMIWFHHHPYSPNSCSG
ncbi:MAG: hypothetical protein GY832_03585 [Chloroflexi bacterium]|nr:hypothetical protein [Chloroflexota bacterium]